MLSAHVFNELINFLLRNFILSFTIIIMSRDDNSWRNLSHNSNGITRIQSISVATNRNYYDIDNAQLL